MHRGRIGDVRHAMNGRNEIAMRLSRWDRRTQSALRPWQTLDYTRLLLAVIYAAVSFGFSSARHWAELAEHGVILLMLALALSAIFLSSRSWVTDMRIRRPVICLDALLFLTLLVVTNPSNSPYFSGSFFVAVEVALIVQRRLHLLVALAAGATAVAMTWLDQIASLPSEPEAERIVLRACYLAVAILVTGVLLGPRRETLLEFERDRRLLEGELPPAGRDHGPFLLHALRLAPGGHGGAVLFRLASHEPLRQQRCPGHAVHGSRQSVDRPDRLARSSPQCVDFSGGGRDCLIGAIVGWRAGMGGAAGCRNAADGQGDDRHF